MHAGADEGDPTADDVDELADRLAADSPAERVDAAWALADVAAASPALVVPVVGSLVPVDDADEWVRRGAAWALAEVGAARPWALKPLFDDLVPALEDDDRLVRESATAAVAAVAAEYPRAARPAVDALIPLLSDEDHLVRRYATEALTAIADVSPARRGAIYPHLTALDADVDLPEGVPVVERKDADESTGAEGDDSPADAATADSGPSAAPSSVGGPAADAPRGHPPDEIPAVESVELSVRDLEPVATLASDRYVDVRAARCTRPDERVVALTTVRREATGDDFDPDFARAMRRWQGIHDHDHVATLVDWGERPRCWAAVEYLDGGSLADRYGAVGDAEALWIARALTRAVAHAHAQGVLHLGLTPASVRFASSLSDAWAAPKVTDWGLAAALRDHVDADALAPRYAAPEQRRDDFGAPDHLTDVYRLGVLLFELFTASRFRPTDEARPAGLSACPEPIRPVLSRALAGPKVERYESVVDLRRELDVLAERSK